MLDVPGADPILLYEPRHPTAYQLCQVARLCQVVPIDCQPTLTIAVTMAVSPSPVTATLTRFGL